MKIVESGKSPGGPYSDGWGYYYLDLVTKLIRQYRQGFRTPQVLLDTRYP